jgi:hypothetical protein
VRFDARSCSDGDDASKETSPQVAELIPRRLWNAAVTNAGLGHFRTSSEDQALIRLTKDVHLTLLTAELHPLTSVSGIGRCDPSAAGQNVIETTLGERARRDGGLDHDLRNVATRDENQLNAT